MHYSYGVIRYVRKFMARRRAKGFGPSFEVKQQATRVVDVYGNKAPLDPIATRSTKTPTRGQGRCGVADVLHGHVQDYGAACVNAALYCILLCRIIVLSL